MPGARSKAKKDDINPDYIRMYYDHQYDRIKKHEEQALNISNIVLTISALIITFGLNNRQSFGSILILFLPAVIIIANLFAIFYIRDSAGWIKSHRMRAKRILETYIPALFTLDSETIAPHKKRTVGRRRFQNLVHVLFIVIAVILLLLFILEIPGVSMAPSEVVRVVTPLPLSITAPTALAVGDNVFDINSRLDWQNTGLCIKQGEEIIFLVESGQWTRWSGHAPYTSGEGDVNYICGKIMYPTECSEPLPTSPAGSLIGRIGDMIFEIGSGTTIISTDGGNLHLRMNDGDSGLFDNDGSLLVKVRK